ncbi:MAG: YebC/PmpR family DNA-binding transcriptional regulator [Candidatus Doudnabacteria bacterium]|nr:YebC/PmpR family DNA-binding transcriptional regulator [Candidatus Doudnabacteria bacterium]
MSGHSKWAQIKRQKAVVDKKKGQTFSKLVREITIAAKEGGDPGMNYKLRLVLDRAKEAGMQKEAIERAVNRGTGEEEGGVLEEVVYEGYGPFGTAFLIEAATDNKNRTVNNIKHVFSKHSGALGTAGSVAWQFVTRGQILVERSGDDMSDIELAAIDAGAEDVRQSAEGLEIYTRPLDLNEVKEKIRVVGGKIVRAEVIKESTQGVDLTDEQKPKVDELFAELENDEDVIAVHTSANL